MKKNIVIIVLAILVLGLGGYLVYDKVLSSDNNNEIENNEIKEDDETFNNALAKILVDDIVELDVYNIFERLSKSGLSEELKLAMAISSLEPVNIYTCEGAFDINTNYGEYRPANNPKWGCAQNGIVDSFSYDLVNKKYKNLFGSLNDVQKINVLETWAYDYSAKIDSYVRLEPRFGPIAPIWYYYDIENIDVVNEELRIEIAYLTYRPTSLDSDTFAYTLNDIIYTNKTEHEIKQAYSDNKNLLPRLTFNYEKQNEKYILKSVKSQFEK